MDESGPIERLRARFDDPPEEGRPLVRWWWFGPDVSEPEIRRELSEIERAGFGGVEIAFVYPLSEGAAPFLEPKSTQLLAAAAAYAAERGLRLDITLGSGWSFGGPHVRPDTAARALHWEVVELGLAEQELQLPTWPFDEVIAAYVGDGTRKEVPLAFEMLPIEQCVVRLPSARGPRLLLVAISRLTGQLVKRAAVGSEGPVLDHYSGHAVRDHIEAVADTLLDAVAGMPIGSVFCDSLEVYGADWTPAMVDEFEHRRGYSLLPVLPWAAVKGAESSRVAADMWQTLCELYEENFVAVLADWARGRGVPFRIQSYGTPPGTVSSYRAADMFEGEGWGWKELTRTRWATSAAHIYDRRVVSSEVWTWVHSPSFRATPLDLKGEAHEHLLAGINQFVGHGWPYSPPEADGLGWFFYAAGALDYRNPWFEAMPLVNRYLHRLSWLLRQGRPDLQVLVYLPARDIAAAWNGGPSFDLWKQSGEWIGPDVIASIRESGLDYAVIDDTAIREQGLDTAKTIIVPFAHDIPEATRRALADASTQTTVISLTTGGEPSSSLSGTRVADPSDLRGILAELKQAPASVGSAADAVGIVHRSTGTVDLYFIANTTEQPQSFTFTSTSGRRVRERWLPDDGAVSAAGRASDQMPVTLAPYQALVIVEHDEEPLPERDLTASDGHRFGLDEAWTARRLDDPNAVPASVSLPHRWEDEDPTYSGTVRYETTFAVDESSALIDQQTWTLDIGEGETADSEGREERLVRGASYRVHYAAPVREVATIIVNGVRCGTLWAPPYRLDISAAIRPGENRLIVDVANTAANALAVDESIARRVEASHRDYGVRFTMQDLEHAMDGVASGLLARPTIHME